MAYNLDNFVGFVSAGDNLLKIYDSNNILKHSVNPFSIVASVRNNILIISTRNKNIELDFLTNNEARLALLKIQEKIEILKDKTPLFVDKEISNYVSEFNTVEVSDIITTNYTLTLSDSNKLIDVASSSSVTLTIPTNSTEEFDIGTQIIIVRGGTGSVGVTSSVGVTINSSQGYLHLNYQYSVATLVKKSTDVWYIFGDLKI